VVLPEPLTPISTITMAQSADQSLWKLPSRSTRS
jgi:hypothetical protein